MSAAPYKLSGLNVAFNQGRRDARAARPPKSTRDMSTFYAAAYLRGYRGQDYYRTANGLLVFRRDASLGIRRSARSVGIRVSPCSSAPANCNLQTAN